MLLSRSGLSIVTCKPLSVSSAPLFSFSQSLSIHFTAGKAEAWEGLESQLHKGRDFHLRCSQHPSSLGQCVARRRGLVKISEGNK